MSNRRRDVTPALVKRLAEVEVREVQLLEGGTGFAKITYFKPFARPIPKRLLNAPEMQNVWRTLQRKKPKPYALEQWRDLTRPLRISDEGASPQDKACGVFFWSASSVWGTRYPIWTQAEVDGSIADLRCGATLADLRSAAELCRQNMKGEDRASGEYAEHARALSDLEERIGRHVRSFAPSHIIDRRGDNDILCAQVRALAVETDKLFGHFMCPTLATVATIALKQTIQEQQVAKWCTTRKPVLQHCP